MITSHQHQLSLNFSVIEVANSLEPLLMVVYCTVRILW